MSWLLSVLVLIADVWALIKTWTSSAPMGTKVIWTLVILFLPLLGLILWYFLGPKS
jgi:hypothetical protein